jgi:hypothetical protein
VNFLSFKKNVALFLDLMNQELYDVENGLVGIEQDTWQLLFKDISDLSVARIVFIYLN